MKKNVLFIETGQFGGGSFNALNNMIDHFKNVKPVIIYFNDNKFINIQKKKNIQCYLLKDYVYSLTVNKYLRKFLNRLNLIISNYLPSFSVFFERIIHNNSINKIKKIIIEHNVDTIHTNVSVARDFFVVFCIKKKIKLFGHLRSPKNQLLNTYKSNIINNNYTNIIAASESIKKHWVESGIKKKLITAIYDGIEINNVENKNIKNLINKKINIKNYFLIGCISRFADGKGQENLIDAFKSLIETQNNNNYLLIFFGDGELENKCKKIAKKNNLLNHIIFLGYIKDAINYISSLDLIILPSSIDVCSNSILEAFLVKKPVICLNAGGNAELIKNDFNGFTYNRQIELIEKIQILKNNDDKLKNFSNEGFNVLKEKFNIKVNIKYIEKILNY